AGGVRPEALRRRVPPAAGDRADGVRVGGSALGAPAAPAPAYSDRSASIGSSPAARRAGIQHAATEIARNSTVIAAYVGGSVGRTCTSIVVIARVSQTAARSPTPSPSAHSFIPSASTWPRMFRALA